MSNVTCALSNLFISSNEEVYFIPLVDNYLNSIKKPEDERRFRIDVSDEWCPICFPLVGKYRSFGNVDLDEPSLKIYNHCIKYIQDTKNVIFAGDTNREQRRFSGCFILKSLADTMINDKKINIFNSGFYNNCSLEKAMEDSFKNAEEFPSLPEDFGSDAISQNMIVLLNRVALREGWEYALSLYGGKFVSHLFVNLYGDWRDHKKDILLMSQLGTLMFFARKMWRPQLNGENSMNSEFDLRYHQIISTFIKNKNK